MVMRFFLVALLVAGASDAAADERVIQYLEDRYTHALMRQVGDTAEGEPVALGVADCTDKRELRRSQRNLARRLGRIFERSGVHGRSAGDKPMVPGDRDGQDAETATCYGRADSRRQRTG